MQHVYDTFLSPLLAVFGEPPSEDPQKFVSEYARLLKGYPVAILEVARDHVMRHHKGPARWPKIAECIKACEEAIESADAKAKASKPQPDDWRRRTANAERLMMSTEIGQQSARDGWALGCREFIMTYGRVPHDHEAGDIIRREMYIDNCAAEKIDMGSLHKSLLPLAQQFIERRNAIAERVINGEMQ